MQLSLKNLLPILLIFLVFSASCFIFSTSFHKYHIDPMLVLGANIFFLVITLFSMLIQLRGIRHHNPHVFVRSVMTGMLLKMVFCIAAVILYVYASGNAFNKRGIFLSLVIYFVYLFAEVRIVMKLNKKPNV